MASLIDDLCGESGLVNQITEIQDEIRINATAGKNAINAVKNFANEVETLQDTIQNQPGVVTDRLQQDIFNILSEEALANPQGTIAKVLDIAAQYQDAGEAVDRMVENLEQFLRDPLNTPINFCKDIPNVVKLGEQVVELAEPAVVPDKPPSPASKDDLTIDVGLSDFETLPRFPSRTIKDSIETIGRYSGDLVPGAADQAARGQ